jgi:hypothetical protein
MQARWSGFSRSAMLRSGCRNCPGGKADGVSVRDSRQRGKPIRSPPLLLLLLPHL